MRSSQLSYAPLKLLLSNESKYIIIPVLCKLILPQFECRWSLLGKKCSAPIRVNLRPSAAELLCS